jgi:hemolysin activation/secretion protein
VLYGVESRSDVAAVGSTNVIGDGTIVGLRYVRALPARAPVAHSVSAGVDWKDFRESVNLLGADTVNTPIRYVPLVAQYSLTLAGERRRTQFSAGASFGPRGWFGNDDRDFSNKRFGARSNFFVLKSDLGHERWFQSGWGLKGQVDIQLASQPLISNEQYSGGGVDSVRGYLENEAQGDDGVRVAFELHSPLLWRFDETSGHGVAALGFVDAASLRVQDPLPSQQASFDFASAGVGLRLRGARRWSGALDVAWPLRDGPQTASGSAQWLFRIGYDF